jgi:formylglycine-generating enzyme required for sulfatase activity
MRPLRVFLCHASQDKPAVRKLHRYLKQRGVQPWLDELDLLPGENWEVEIPKALFSSDVILVCLSKNSVDKEGYVQKEITFALDKALEKPEGTIFIVPVKLEDCEVPRRLKQYQWVDLFRQDGYKRLMLGLQKRASGLGADVSPVILEETRRPPKVEKKKPEEPIVSAPVPTEKVKEEPKKEVPAPPQEKKEPEVKFTQQKPFTKLLDPASLAPKQAPPVGRVSNLTDTVAPKKRQAKSLTYGFWGIGLLALLLVGIGLNSLLKNPPAATATNSPTPNLPTFTSVPFTPPPTLTKTAVPTPALGVGSTMTGDHGETLVYVPAGEFKMGSENGEDDEKPVHTVYLDAFWIDQIEVTNKQYQACVDAGTCEPPSSKNSYTHPSYYENPEFDNYPVIYVNWDKANRYCEVWAGGDLPTEAQWEKAARGTGSFTYLWGEGIDCNKSNFWGKVDGCVGDTTPVGSYEIDKSPYGAYDMAGNIEEWVNDYYQSDYYALLGDSASNPAGPESGVYRVLRGGSWLGSSSFVRATHRFRYDPSYSDGSLGFRCSRSAE